jgi:hypothetical protein
MPLRQQVIAVERANRMNPERIANRFSQIKYTLIPMAESYIQVNKVVVFALCSGTTCQAAKPVI